MKLRKATTEALIPSTWRTMPKKDIPKQYKTISYAAGGSYSPAQRRPSWRAESINLTIAEALNGCRGT